MKWKFGWGGGGQGFLASFFRGGFLFWGKVGGKGLKIGQIASRHLWTATNVNFLILNKKQHFNQGKMVVRGKGILKKITLLPKCSQTWFDSRKAPGFSSASIP